MKKAIQEIVDKHLQKWIDLGIICVPKEIETDIVDSEDEEDDEDEFQLPIESTATDEDIEELEAALGHVLPITFKTFLKYKHFDELYISEARFAGYGQSSWKNVLPDMAFDGYPRELLIDQGYIPFADWNDWGLLCFNTNSISSDSEYQIVVWDHERDKEYLPVSENFYELLVKLDSEEIKNVG